MAKANQRDKILDAVEKILKTKPSSDLSLDLISLTAGVSKGGLLYHFPTKESVLVGAIDRLIQVFESDLLQISESNGSDFCESYLSASMNPKLLSAAKSLVAAASHDPKLLVPLRSAYKRWDKIIFSKFQNPLEAWKFRIFFDGLFFCSILNLPTPSRKELKKILSSLR